MLVSTDGVSEVTVLRFWQELKHCSKRRPARTCSRIGAWAAAPEARKRPSKHIHIFALETSEEHVYSKLLSFIHFSVALVLCLTGALALWGETPDAAPAAPATASIHGHITDPTGAFIPGASITVATSVGVTVRTATADSAGSYTVNSLQPGGYIVASHGGWFLPPSLPRQSNLQRARQSASTSPWPWRSSSRVSLSPTIRQWSARKPKLTPTPSSSRTRIWMRSPTIPTSWPANLDCPCRPLRRSQRRPNLHRRLQRRATPAQVGHSRNSHQPESLFGGVRPPRLRAHRDPHQARHRQAARTVLHPGQRQGLQHRQPVHVDHPLL